VLELTGVAVDAHHDVLEDVLGDVAVGNAPGDESEQAPVKSRQIASASSGSTGR
jgi:hypothetical protein